jgi:hypothetical protein
MKSNIIVFSREQERLIETMRQNVEQKKKAYKEDFYRYDLSFIRTAVEEGIKDFIWFLSDSGTHFVEEYEHSEQQEYLRNMEAEEGHHIQSGHANLFHCNLQTGQMKKLQSFQDIYVR